MKKSYLLAAILVSAFALALVASAQEKSARTHDSGVRDTVKKQVAPAKGQVKDIRKDLKDIKKDIKTDIKDVRKEVKSNVKDKKDEIKKEERVLKEDFKAKKEQLEQRKKEFEEKIKTERKALEDKIKEKREDLKERLEKVKDERKKQIVDRVDQSMDQLNDRMVKHFTQVLDKIEAVLKRIGERADRADKRGLDVSTVRAAIDEAVKAIGDAREAIRVQAGKTYTINVTDEATLKNKVGEARQLLRKDLKVVQDAVKAAHEAVRKAATTLAQLPRPTPIPTIKQIDSFEDCVEAGYPIQESLPRKCSTPNGGTFVE